MRAVPFDFLRCVVGIVIVRQWQRPLHGMRPARASSPSIQRSSYRSTKPRLPTNSNFLDLRDWDNCLLATRGNIDQVYNLAADMGGIEYITAKLADIARNNTLINTHMLEAARTNGIRRFLSSSSACVYAGYRQKEAEIAPLREEDAYPADPEPGYGW